MFMPSYVQVNEDEEEQVDLCVLSLLIILRLFCPCFTVQNIEVCLSLLYCNTY